MPIRPLPQFSFRRIGQPETGSPYLNAERSAVRAAGGRVNKTLNGPDGRSILFNKPIEVKYANKDDRFRINQKDHEQMLRENGTYVFIHSNMKRQLTARQADSLLAYKWLKDRDYPHSFIFVKDVFR